MSRLTTVALLTALCLPAACLRRDVSTAEPTTKSSFATVVPQPAIDKVDLLLLVDNSSSMADKQRILADAVPDLVRGLVQPKCVDKKTRTPVGVLSDPLKPDAEKCPAGSEPAFPPITDMHVGVLSSSLGGMGSKTTCKPTPGHHNDDRGRLIARGPDGRDLAQAGDLHFLAWYPDVEQNRDKVRHPDPPVPATHDLQALADSFRQLVVGVGQDGCGLEAQLESVYRFLVQPDPWTEIDVVDGRASYGPAGRVDGDLLRQRAAFLRPNSLVAVVVLSDEDDSSVDPLAFQGSAWRFEEAAVASGGVCASCLPRATAACQSDPGSPACTSCAFKPDDPACAVNGGLYAPEEDSLNVRFHAMKRRFGVDPQFPIARYVDAFTKPRIPSRASEHEPGGAYVGRPECTNPLFAARLPSQPEDDLCTLPRGPRAKDLVYFAVIGGVPNQLLPASGGAADIDWTRILGRDPSRHDETGIDAHMIASTEPRPGLPAATAADDADPIHGREWATGGTDLQFACTFDLYERKPDGTSAPAPRTCPAGDTTCDCDGTRATPLCAADDPRTQVKGKAYPTRRELMVARELGNNAIVASLCPKQLSRPEGEDYGYRPAVRAITERLEGSLVGPCIPRPLERDPKDGTVPCLVLATLPEPGPDSVCAELGLGTPDAGVLSSFRDRVAAEEGEGSRLFPVCLVPQVSVPAGESCRDEARELGFCYAEKVPGARCPQSLLFTKATAKLVDARFTMQCIQVEGSP